VNETGLKTEFVWVITQRVVVISYRRFGTTSRFSLQGWRIQKRLGCCNSRLISSNNRNKIRFIKKRRRETFCSISTSTSKTSKFWETTRMELVLTLFIKTSFYFYIKKVKVKVKWSRHRPGVAQRVGRSIALLFHDRGTRRWWVVSSTPRPHFTPGKDSVPILQETGWAPGPVWTGGKSRPHRDSILNNPARSQSLYRLSYPAHLCTILCTLNHILIFTSTRCVIHCCHFHGVQLYRYLFSAYPIDVI